MKDIPQLASELSELTFADIQNRRLQSEPGALELANPYKRGLCLHAAVAHKKFGVRLDQTSYTSYGSVPHTSMIQRYFAERRPEDDPQLVVHDYENLDGSQ